VEEEKKNLNKDKHYWRPVMIFYAKTTAWIILPLILAMFAGRNINPKLSFVFVMIGFGISCFGIYREIKQYKKDLDKKEK